ncbi:hypothetical protein [Giesbergeria anulus]|uniref:Uncharacterized protein n=1 Tax=Giesbergeria anulus TaxID=180197 RepID=A0A1H9NRF4_9BURK|nr:hypothetical protein [Giesbergeria anulus]SER38209.1 hypothetical protein SAMN02982919_02306 [Giesbergeria anulus]
MIEDYLNTNNAKSLIFPEIGFLGTIALGSIRIGIDATLFIIYGSMKVAVVFFVTALFVEKILKFAEIRGNKKTNYWLEKAVDTKDKVGCIVLWLLAHCLIIAMLRTVSQ